MREYVFVDGFDCYTDWRQRWDENWGNFMNGGWGIGCAVEATGGRHGTGCMHKFGGSVGFPYGYSNHGGMRRSRFDNKEIWLVGVAAKNMTTGGSGNSGGGYPILYVTGGANIGLAVTMIGAVEVYHVNAQGGKDVLHTTRPGLIFTNLWNYYEIKANFATGDVEVHINGDERPLVQETGLLAGGSSANTLILGTPKLDGFNDCEQYFDDLYVEYGDAEPYGEEPEFKGDCRVCTLMPDGQGTYTEWTPVMVGSAAPGNWDCVNEKPANETDYVVADEPGDRDTYAHQDLPVDVDDDAIIYCVAVSPFAKKDAAGVCEIAPMVRSNGADLDGPTFIPLTEYSYFTGFFETDPGASAAWTKATVNAMEFGQKVID